MQGMHLCHSVCSPAHYSIQRTLYKGISPCFMSKKGPLPMSGGFRHVHTVEGKTWPQQLYSHLSWWGFTTVSRWTGANSHLFAALVWLCFGGAFSLTFPPLYFNFCHCLVSFHCHGRTFLSLQHLVTSEADNAVGGGRRRDSSSRSPRFAERGHYCLTFLLEFSIPTVP